MKKYYLVGNHKMNSTLSDEINFVDNLNKLLTCQPKNVFFGIAASPCNLALKFLSDTSKIKIGSQNVSMYDPGAYTGDVSAKQLVDLKMDFTIIGHSERRLFFNDTPQKINTRIKQAIENNLKVILCIGETLQEYKNSETLKSLTHQIDEELKDIKNPEDIIISYEPIWSIGTGLVADNDHLEQIFKFLENKLPHNTFMYGGSAKPQNVLHLLQVPQISGFLVGGASQKADSFYEMLQLMEKYIETQK